jgi:hypothetical protein
VSPFDLSAGQSGRIGFSPASAPGGVHWIRPEQPRYRPPPLPTSSAQETSERAHALIVIVLTLACTVLAIFDLFLLASGV